MAKNYTFTPNLRNKFNLGRLLIHKQNDATSNRQKLTRQNPTRQKPTRQIQQNRQLVKSQLVKKQLVKKLTSQKS